MSEPGPAAARPPLGSGPGRVLLEGAAIAAAVERLGAEIRAAYAGRELTVLVVLDGALVFAADLIRQLDVPLRVETVSARSYRGAATGPGRLELHLAAGPRLAGRHVLVVEDILDTGRTLQRLRREIEAHGPASLRIVTLLDKPERRLVDVRADFVGFTIPDVFVVGYGLDHDGRHRNLPCIRALCAPGEDG